MSNVYIGKIVAIQFHPMVVILSYLDIEVFIAQINTTVQIRDRGTIEELSQKYGFKIVSEHQWDLRPMQDKMCRIAVDSRGFYFGSIKQIV